MHSFFETEFDSRRLRISLITKEATSVQKRLNHYHRYKKVTLGKKKDYVVYKCQDADCKHYIAPQLLIGKQASCFYCKELFIVSAEQIRKEQMKLHCKACTGKSSGTNLTRRKPNVSSDKVNSILERLGLSAED